MKIIKWLKSRMSEGRRAEWLYRRDMLRAKLQKHAEAITDYTAVIDLMGVPASTRAMALDNRALVHHASKGNATP